MTERDWSVIPRSQFGFTVSYYTSQEAYPYDRRDPNEHLSTMSRDGGIYCGWHRPVNQRPLSCKVPV